MHVVIAKVDEVLYEGEAHSLTVPGAAGEMTVLHAHMPLITTLKPGNVRVQATKESEPRMFPVQNGILEVRRDGATIIL